MRIEPFDDRDGYRCWLSQSEQRALVEHFGDENPRKRLAVELGLDGLRTDEITRVTVSHFREMNQDVLDTAYKLRVPESKTGYRETPVSGETHRLATIYGADGPTDAPLVDVSERTVRRWVKGAADELAAQSGTDDDWTHVTPHDLRRTWATETYYRLAVDHAAGVVRDVVMAWGGWTDEEVFRENYLGAVPDGIAAQLMDHAGLA